MKFIYIYTDTSVISAIEVWEFPLSPTLTEILIQWKIYYVIESDVASLTSSKTKTLQIKSITALICQCG